MEQLTDSLGWGYGLPDDPLAEDYIALLSGVRNLHVEAEDNHRRSDRVAVKRLSNYGKYSGTGWVSGRSEPVQLHLDVLVPHNGRYQLSATTRLSSVRIKVAGQEFVGSAGNKFSSQDLGQVDLVAGPTEILVTLPPNAGIDYLRLSAPPLPVIAPLAGWQPDRPLKIPDLALTMLQALDLLSTLPVADQINRIEAESAALQSGVQLSRNRHLGVPSGQGWIRAGHQNAAWQLSFSLRQPGCYQLSLRGISNTPVRVVLDDLIETRVEFGPALKSKSLGVYCLPEGELTLELELPPWAGIDSLEIRGFDISQASVTRLLGLPLTDDGVDSRTVNELLQLLSSLTY
jgi:hypothetical protein